jgi:hypothetical protein
MTVPSNGIQSFVPNDLLIPSQFEIANPILTDYFRRMVSALNDKDIGQYNTIPIVNGQKWFTPGDANRERFVYRLVVNFGALPNAATKTVAHSITTTANTIFTRIYGTATDPGAATITSAIPLPFASSTLNQNIILSVDAANVIITTAIDYSMYTTTYVVLEYILD